MFVFFDGIISLNRLSSVSVGDVLFSPFPFWFSDVSFRFFVVVMSFTVKSATFICVSSHIFPLLLETSFHIILYIFWRCS